MHLLGNNMIQPHAQAELKFTEWKVETSQDAQTDLWHLLPWFFLSTSPKREWIHLGKKITPQLGSKQGQDAKMAAEKR